SSDLSNLESLKADNPRWLNRHQIVTSKHGVRVGIIGLTAQFNTYYNLLGWHLHPTFDTIEKQLAQIREKTDVIVLLSHLGIHEDQRIAEQDRKSTRLNSSHVKISYAVFCLKK